MNALDIGILVAVVGAGVGGWRLGFLARVVSWIGLAAGLYAGARLLPAALRAVNGPDPTVKLAIAAGVLMVGAFVGQALGLLAGASLKRFVPVGPIRTVDRAVGAVVGALGVVCMVWLLLPAFSDVPGGAARLARNSAIARTIDRSLPPAPDTLQALRSLVGETNFPRVFEALRPTPAVGPPPASAGIPVEVVNRVAASTVKVEGIACDRRQEGSGFVVAPETIATNAHVVAGQRPGRTKVVRLDGEILDAFVTVFDPGRDLALLRVPGLGRAALPLGEADVGDRGAVFGHPGGQDDLRVAPAAVRQRVDAVGRDLYDRTATRRDVYILATELRPGDSGGALVLPDGSVAGVAFAIAPDRNATAYALSTRELRAVLALPGGRASTGDCLRSR